LDIEVKLLLSINRAETKESAMETVKLAIQFMDKGVVGIDLSGNPHVGNVEDFIPALQYAKEHGLLLSLHVAELENHKETKTLLELKPGRIGHAVFLDKWLVEEMRKNPIPLEICITSNVKTHSVSSYIDHHFKNFYKSYPIVLCTDDRGVFSTSLSKEYAIVAKAFGISKEDLFQLAIHAIDFIFADEETKKKLRIKFEEIKKHM